MTSLNEHTDTELLAALGEVIARRLLESVGIEVLREHNEGNDSCDLDDDFEEAQCDIREAVELGIAAVVAEHDLPAFYEDHDGMIAAHKAEVCNYGWAQGDTYITSKTSLGILHTELDAQGVVSHHWLPYIGSPFAVGFSKDITEPIPANPPTP